MFIVTKEIDSENISKLCRTCLREDSDKMICLFVGPAGSSLAAKLRSLSCLEVWQGDGLPEKMCDRCVTRAESALLYREQCRAADRALRQAASKVSSPTFYAAVSGCKFYQQNQSFTQIQNSQKTLKCIECGAVFANYHELYAHNRLHIPSVRNDTPMRHMHIVESRSTYFNFSHSANNLTDEDDHGTRTAPPVESNSTHAVSANENGRAACALHCSLCNRTFTNRRQLISHNFTHDTDDADLSCGGDNVETHEDSERIAQNLSYDGTIEHSDPIPRIQNLSYAGAPPLGSDRELRNLGFSGDVDSVEIGRDHGVDPVRNLTMNGECGMQVSQVLRYSEISERVKSLGDIGNENHDDSSSARTFKLDASTKEVALAGSGKHECNACPKSFSQKSKLLAHQLSHTGQRPFACTTCEKAYASKSKLNAHMRLHTKSNVHPCSVCGKIFPYPSYLEDHAKVHNSKSTVATNRTLSKNYECAYCEKRFHLVKNLKVHQKLHTGKGLVRCEFCDKRFGQKYNLKVHLRTHKESKTHECEFCEKSFVQKGNLMEHLRVHTKVKPFECHVCGKCFSQSSHLKSHELSHDSTRRHQCRLCGKRFKLASHLKRHSNLHTGTKTYECDQCGRMFSRAFSLKRHSKRHNESHA